MGLAQHSTDMSTTTPPQTGADVMAQFIPKSPFVAKLGIVADVLDGDEVRLRLPWDESNVTVGDMVHGGAIAALADVAVMAAAWSGAQVPDSLRGVTRRCRCSFSRRRGRPTSSRSAGCCAAASRWSTATSTW
jgi:acyl-coenzyme A thioesterase PaaI-like protein